MSAVTATVLNWIVLGSISDLKIDLRIDFGFFKASAVIRYCSAATHKTFSCLYQTFLKDLTSTCDDEIVIHIWQQSNIYAQFEFKGKKKKHVNRICVKE